MKAFLETQERKTRIPPVSAFWRTFGRLCIVLSLVALVFSACSSGDGDGGGTNSRGKDVLEIRVIKDPDQLSYEGLPVNLKGIQVRVSYTDGTSEVITDETKFYTMPNSVGRPGADVPRDTWGFVSGYKGIFSSSAGSAGGDVLIMPIPQDYMFAEYRVLNYLLAYNPNGREVKTAPFKIPGVLDIVEIDYMTPLPKMEYYIDDVIDFSGVMIQIQYNDEKGFFATNNGGDNAYLGSGNIGDMNGTVRRVTVPFNPTWDWSLNPARANQKKPFIQVSIGDRLVKNASNLALADTILGPGAVTSNGTVDVNRLERLCRHDESFDKLYMVTKLEIDSTTPIKLEEPYFTNYEASKSYTNERDEWLHTALKDVRVIVNYKDEGSGAVPPPKYIVLDPKRNSMELPMDRHLWDWPLLNGPLSQIRGPMPDAVDGGGNYLYNPDFGHFVFVHFNDERYWDPYWDRFFQLNNQTYKYLGTTTPNSPFLTNARNANFANLVYTISDHPVKVYVLGEGEDGSDGDGGEVVVVNANEEFVNSPTSARGNYKDFLSNLTLTVQYVYVDRSTGDVDGEPITYTIPVDDPRLEFYGGTGWPTPLTPDGVHRKHIVIDNTVRQQGTGIYDPLTWMVANEYAFGVRYTDSSGMADSGADAIELIITDPRE